MSLHGSPTPSPRRTSTSSSASALAASAFALVFVAACSSQGDAKEGQRTKAPLPAGEAQEDESARVPDSPAPPVDTSGSAAPTVPTGRCEVDADCARVEKGCCPVGDYVGMLRSQVDGYQQSLSCAAVACPLIMVLDDHSVAQCNAQQTCEVVKPRTIECNGFTPNPHACPDGWHCRVRDDITDVPGVCIQMCGGFANIQCSTPHDTCIDDPTDECDPKNGGADCGGMCVPGTP